MELSSHGYIDKYGYRCAIQISSEEDIVVFNSTPKLSFDLKEHGIKIKRSKYHDYTLHYVLKDGQIFLCGFGAGFPFYRKKAQIFGADPYKYDNSKWNHFDFDDIPVEYSGTLSIGRDFDKKYWTEDEKATPTPFSPEVYKENGYIKFEKGRVVEKELFSRKRDL